MQVEIKLLNDKAKLPSRAHTTDAGFDLSSTSIKYTEGYIEYGTGLAFSIPEGYVGLLFPRSSVSNKSLSMANSVGVIDAGYHGEVTVRFRRVNGIRDQKVYDVGERVGQLIILPIPEISFTIVKEFDKRSDRGTGGYGSTGK